MKRIGVVRIKVICANPLVLPQGENRISYREKCAALSIGMTEEKIFSEKTCVFDHLRLAPSL